MEIIKDLPEVFEEFAEQSYIRRRKIFAKQEVVPT